MNADHRRLDRLREEQGDIGNHVIDEYVAGTDLAPGLHPARLGRRAVAARARRACCPRAAARAPHRHRAAAAGKSGATIKAGITVPTGAINPVTVADQGGLDMLAQTGEYLCLSDQTLTLKPVLATSWTPNSTADVWTFKIRQGVKFHNGAALTADDVVYTYKLQTEPGGQVGGAVGARRRADPVGRAEGRRLHRRVPPRGAERELPVPGLVRQLQHDHHPEQLRPGEVAELVRRHRPVRDEELHRKGRRGVHPQRAVLGPQGAARGHPVHLLRRPDIQ